MTDAEWERVCQRMVSVAGVAPDGDGYGCRWVAVRHDGDESRHIHVVATLARQDDRRPSIHNDALRLRDECRRLERELGLRATSESNRTSARLPQRGETEKAGRRGLVEAPRSILARQVRAAAVAAVSEEDFFSLLEFSGVLVHFRFGLDGEIEGYSVSLPGDENPEGEPIWFGGGSLAPDLSLLAVRQRFAGGFPDTLNGPEDIWADLAGALRRVHQELGLMSAPRRSATASAFGDVLTAMAGVVPPSLVVLFGDAARKWEHAGRLPVPYEDHAGAAELRKIARALGRAQIPDDVSDQVVGAVPALLLVAMALSEWYQSQGWESQEYAAQESIRALGAVRER
ncbi:MAG: hypothetical protein M0026_00380 [Nocardiopsaceae bacterium]|nr:hypothetical protein [Nocardiopsaceae bacterium]